MSKIKLSHRIFGYRILRVNGEKEKELASLFIKGGVSAVFLSDGTVVIKESECERVKNLLFGVAEYTLSEPRGAFGFIKQNRRRYGIISAIILTLLLSLLSYDTVWDIRISGNECISEEQVLKELEKCGFSSGSLWHRKDRSDIESRLLASSPDIAWININRRGSVAYVDIIERVSHEDEPIMYDYANIVADRDCVIEEITVKSGFAAVKVGDIVKKGDILISGVPEGEVGSFCIADGTVRGRAYGRVEVFQERTVEEKIEKGEKISGFALKIFKKNVNIFKIYGNLGGECDIIEKTENIYAFNKVKLPIKATKTYVKEYSVTKRTLTDNELSALTKEKTSYAILDFIGEGELVKARSSGSVTAEGYTMSTDIVYITSVGSTVPFVIEK